MYKPRGYTRKTSNTADSPGVLLDLAYVKSGPWISCRALLDCNDRGVHCYVFFIFVEKYLTVGKMYVNCKIIFTMKS